MSIARHGADVVTGTSRESFWRRQFDADVTPSQALYDVAFGFLLPIACFVMDPGLFREVRLFGGPEYPGLTVTVYVFAALSMATLAFWLLVGRLGPWLAGPLLAAAAGAAALGVLIAPWTLVGLLFAIGWLGLIPFFTAFVFLRNGVRAARSAGVRWRPGRVAAAIVLAGLVSVGVPLAAKRRVEGAISRAIVAVRAAEPERRAKGMATLRRTRWFWSRSTFWMEWVEAREPEKTRIEVAFRELTGREISADSD